MMIATHMGTQQDLTGQLEHLSAELGDLRASLQGRDAYMMANTHAEYLCTKAVTKEAA